MIAHVALPLPIDKIFSYALPAGMALFTKPFSRVKVPFNNRSLTAFVLDIEEAEEEGLKAVQDLVDCVPLIDDTCARLCQWASRHYVTPVGLTLKYALSSSIKIEKYCRVKAKDPSVSHLDDVLLGKAYGLAGKEPVLDYLNRSLITLCDVFTGREIESKDTVKHTDAHRTTLYLGQIEDRQGFYISVVAKELQQGRNVLVLVPDHQVVGDFFHRSFVKCFPDAVLWFHSRMTEKKRAETYFRARSEGGHLILGSKSAVFLPLASNGLVIVERPEEDEYRNEEAFKFNAVRLAMKRAEIEGVPVILGSIAPPVEAIRWAEEGSIDIESGPMAGNPSVSCTRSERGKGREAHLPDALVSAIRDVVDRGGNVVVHTPRRAYASSLYCGACGQWLFCPTCAGASLNYNRAAESLTCNTCKGVIPYEERCSHCDAPFIRFLDVGAEYVEARLREAFPDKFILRITGEAGARHDRRSLRTGAQKGSIIVGTHVLSKLYGIRADLLILYGWEDFLRVGGYRAREKMFQVFTNLIDALRPNDLLLHTCGKEPFDVALFLDKRRFYEDELEKRKKADFPPYVRLFLVNILKRNERAGQRVMEAIDRLVERELLDHQMLGPIDVKGHYGWRVILKGNDLSSSPLLASLYRLSGVHIEADPLYL
jgi:primosomal protein N' (replication factor Y) (superfamily II helicase)